MKVLSLNGNYGGLEPQVALIADSSILPSGRGPLYEPRATLLYGRAAIAYRVHRLGKSIKASYANRYIDAVAAAVLVRASREQSGQPCERWSALTTSLDGALILGEWQTLAPCSAFVAHRVTISDSDRQVAEAAEHAVTVDIAHAIEWLSGHFTLKTGDIIVTDAGPEEFAMPIGTRLIGCLDHKATTLMMNVK